ncbi:glycosyltransferase family 2 protein [candidate division KSB1 bacterium]|nr:MAG: glycosyltransferase family 2 protein [candidate division KSB1 bacterium]
MKLIIQIPCYNEEKTLPETLKSIPREFSGIDKTEILVIDDGSTDRTVEVARDFGVDHIIKLTSNKGLAGSFSAGLDACLRLGADIIVNTDGDNQYNAEDIEKLIEPIIRGRADMVVGDREVMQIEHFSFIKKRLQKLGSWVVQQVSGTTVPDVTSGFRAFSRDAALRLNVISNFTYTLETIIQAGKKSILVTHVPVRTNRPTRPSRLFKSMFAYLKQSGSTIARIYALYEPFKTFLYIGGIIFGTGLIISGRFLYFYLIGNGEGHIQSLILAAVLMIVGFQVGMIGLLADIISANRRLIEDILYRIRKNEVKKD